MGKWQRNFTGMHDKEMDTLFLSNVGWSSYPAVWINDATSLWEAHSWDLTGPFLSMGTDWSRTFPVRHRTADLISFKIIRF